MFEVLVVVVLGSGGCSHGIVEKSRPQVDTVAVLQAAFEHHFEEALLDSAALNVEPSFGSDIGVRVDILERLAEKVGVPLARYSEVHSCDGPRISRRCSLSGMKQLLGVRLQSLEEGRAEVGVFSFHEWREGRVDVGGALYAVEYQHDQWVVTERLMVWAS